MREVHAASVALAKKHRQPAFVIPASRLHNIERKNRIPSIHRLYALAHPPQHAAVFCVDEKSAIQALDRLDPVLPMSPGRAERHGFEYYRHGTLSLYAALEVRSGKVHGKTAARHTSDEFVDFLDDVVGLCRPQQ